MSAVWRASRAAVRRRRLQTVIIGLVVGISTATMVVALGLVAVSSAPFDQAFARQNGAHVVAAFDPARTSDAQLAATAGRPGVQAAAGPFGQAVLDVSLAPDRPALPLTVVGRADPGGPVDQLNLWSGRWAAGPGEIVLNVNPAEQVMSPIGDRITAGGGEYTVVGYAYSVSRTADAWVTPAQVAALHPTTTQMLYRFAASATAAQLAAGLTSAAGELPADAVLGSRSYLGVKQSVDAGAGAFVPFLAVFGFLGLAVAVLIVANVISGAVVAGFRHIGILKALGFTPNQVLAVYLLMVSVPATVGCVLGAVLGNVLAFPLLNDAVRGFGSGSVTVAPWVDAVALLGMPAVVLLAAVLPALRARRVSAVEAISAGSTQRTGRGLRLQRWLGGTRLPRSVSLGLGAPFARPARSALTMAAVVLGITAVTFAIGLSSSLTRFADGDPAHHSAGIQAVVLTGDPGPAATKLGDAGTASMLGSVPGAQRVVAEGFVPVSILGTAQITCPTFYRGDTSNLGHLLVRGRWYAGADEIVVTSKFLHERGVAVGEALLLNVAGRQARVTVVGQVMAGGACQFLAGWDTLERLAPGTAAYRYDIQLAPGTDADAYLSKVLAADPGLQRADPPSMSSFNVLVIGLSSLLTLMLGTVSALGVFNTVVLNTRERRRDLGMLKSIGMTPRQVTVMLVTSMAALGAVGGLVGIPLGTLAHRLVLPDMASSAGVDFPASVLRVWTAPTLGLLAVAGIVLAALGALIPARSAARLTIAEVLHNE